MTDMTNNPNHMRAGNIEVDRNSTGTTVAVYTNNKLTNQVYVNERAMVGEVSETNGNIVAKFITDPDLAERIRSAADLALRTGGKLDPKFGNDISEAVSDLKLVAANAQQVVKSSGPERF